MPARPPLRLLLVALAGALAVAACSDEGELGGPGLGGGVAARVGDTAITHADLEEEVERWATSPDFLRAVQVSDLGREGRRSAALVTFVLSHRIFSEQARQLAVDTGFEPQAGRVDQIIAEVDATFSAPNGGSLFQVYDDDFRRILGNDLAYQEALQGITDPDVEAPVVAVSPRYGEVTTFGGGVAQVAPPPGPLQSRAPDPGA